MILAIVFLVVNSKIFNLWNNHMLLCESSKNIRKYANKLLQIIEGCKIKFELFS